MSEIITIKCKRCNGTGQMPFNGAIADTLRMLRKLREPVTGAATARRLGNVKPSAMNNRLAYLENIGLAESERYGRERKFKAVTP